KSAKLLESIGQVAEPTMPDKKSDDWFAKGEAALKAGDKGQALQAFEKSLERDGSHLPKARLQVAILLLETNDPVKSERAVALLEDNLKPEVQKDREAHEGSLYLLGFTHYQKRDWRKAEFRFSQALDFYPDSAQAVKGRYHLGRCYWFMAAQEA